MNHLAYLTAVYWLGERYHSGQGSRGYYLLCLAWQRAFREHCCVDLGRTCEQLRTHSKLYPKHTPFRREVARHLFNMRRVRNKL